MKIILLVNKDLEANLAHNSLKEELLKHQVKIYYLLLSELIEKVVGYGHHQYIKEKILIPLGITNTFSSIEDVEMKRLMSGYYVGIVEDIKTADYGSMVATAEDVGIFLRALNDGSLFEEIYASIYVYETIRG